ncbi:MAG: ABC transporter ATP-binding protein [Pseudomonadota bacterium]
MTATSLAGASRSVGNGSEAHVHLDNVSFRSGSENWLYPLSLNIAHGEFNLLLGATRAGKTTLLRILAGLERPSTGRIHFKGRDVTRVPVRDRGVAMVYQQFINYPSFTVYENIASPLRVAGVAAAEIRSRVNAIAEVLHLSAWLGRYPAQLSGGQQQRVALARAMAKEAQLLLLDEPLANLDYKLREEFRSELPRLFAQRQTTVVYATTEPQEALQLGGHTHLLVAGRLIQSGPTLDLFRRPATLLAAQAFSDPPLNVFPGHLDAANGRVVLGDGSDWKLPQSMLASLPASTAAVTLGLRPHQLSLERGATAACSLDGRVELAEISGSETYVHMSRGNLSVVAQVPGVHRLGLGASCTLYFDPENLYAFDPSGAAVFSPGSRDHGTHSAR